MGRNDKFTLYTNLKEPERGRACRYEELLRSSGSHCIRFQPILAKICGDTAAGLLLSQAIYWSARTGADGWFFKTSEEWTQETGLSRYQQVQARRKLRGHHLCHEKRRGAPPILHFRVDFEALCIAVATHISVQGKRTIPNDKSNKHEKADFGESNCPKSLVEMIESHHLDSPRSVNSYKEAETTAINTTERNPPYPPLVDQFTRLVNSKKFPESRANAPESSAWSIVKTALKVELASASIACSHLDPNDFDTFFRDTWQSHLTEEVLTIGTYTPEETAMGLQRYEKRIQRLIASVFGAPRRISLVYVPRATPKNVSASGECDEIHDDDRKQCQLELIEWFERLASFPLTTEQRNALEEWEAAGNGPTSEWPGWVGLLPPKPKWSTTDMRQITNALQTPKEQGRQLRARTAR